MPGYRDDPKHIEAKKSMEEHFTNKLGKAIMTPYYQSQLQIFYEDDFFPWIVGGALKELVEEGFLVILDFQKIMKIQNLKNISRMNFYARRETVENEENENRVVAHAGSIAKIVDEYSDPKNSKLIGNHLETLVGQELRAQEFDIIGTNTKEYGGKKWTQTDHDLDIIAKHRYGSLVIGVEIKNTLDVMSPDEIDIKIDICKHLEIMPIFAVRWVKPYFDCIRRQGGFSWIFKTQIYPTGKDEFTKKLYEKLSNLEKFNGRNHSLEFPIKARTTLPEGSINNFSNWLKTHKDHEVEFTDYRCSK